MKKKGGKKYSRLRVLYRGSNAFTLALFAIVLIIWSVVVSQSNWQGTKDYHFVLELASSFVALTIAIIALIRYYARSAPTLLFIGCAFLSVFVLDLLNAVVVLPAFNELFSRPVILISPWSWFASRLALSFFLLSSAFYLSKKKDFKHSPAWWYLAVIGITVFSFLYFTSLPLPSTYHPDLFFHRPWEVIPGIVFALSLVYFMKANYWKTSRVYQWVVVGLIINISIQFLYMPFSGSLFDSYFITSKFLKLVSYIIILAGFLSSVAHLYEKSSKQAQDLQKFKLALDDISDHVIITDADGVILYANRAVETITGFSPKEVINKKAGSKELWGGCMNKSFYKEMWKTIKVKKQNFKGVMTNKRKSGEKYIVESNISPVLSKDGEVEYFVAIERDVTKEKQIDEAKTEFVSLASHQLRTPLTAISWYTEMLLDGDGGKVTNKQKEYLNEIYNGNERMIALVRSLLNVSRLELGKFIVELELSSVNKIAKSLVDELQPKIKEKNLKLKTNFDKSIPDMKVDPKLLRIVFQNVLSNAIKYTDSGGRVGFSMKKNTKDKVIEIEISDTGMGIPKNQQSRIFTKLFRADNAIESVTDGNGLGLYITKKILDHSGGTIRFDSKEGEGTTFFVTLPLSGMKSKKGTRTLEVMAV